MGKHFVEYAELSAKWMEEADADQLRGYIEGLSDVNAALRARVQRLEAALRGFAETAEAAVAHAERPKGGMQVPFHGDFAAACALPSVIGNLRWWAREFRRALAATGPETESAE